MTQPKAVRETGLRVAYRRVSTGKQAKKYSLPQQTEAIERSAPGPIDRWFEDVETGTKEDRKNWVRLQELVAQGGVSEVWVLCMDRFARDEYDALRVSRDFRKFKTKLLFVEGQTDLETPEGRAQFGIQAVFSALEHARIRARSMDKRQRKMDQENRPDSWHLPLGFAVEDDWPLIVPERAEIARQIFDWRWRGKSMYRICGLLEAAGYKPERGAHWGESSIRRILQGGPQGGPNRSYIGEYHRCGKVWPIRDKQGNFLSIIDPKIFAEVEAMTAALPQQLVGAPVKLPFLLHKMGWCGLPGCGKRLQCVVDGGGPGKPRYRGYRCRGAIRCKAAFEPPCKSSRIPAELLEQLVWAEIWSILRDPERLRKLALAFVHEQREAAHLTEDPHQQLAALKAREGRVIWQHEEGIINDQVLKQKLGNLKRKMGLLEMAIRALPQIIPIAPLAEVERMCAQIAGGEEPDDYEGRRDVLEHLHDMRVTVFSKQEAKITAKLPVDQAAAPAGKFAHTGLPVCGNLFAPIPFEIKVRFAA